MNARSSGTNADESVFEVHSRDGLALAVGAHPAGGDGPVVIVVHGIASHMGWYRSVARALADRGVATYLPDRRGAGRSEGTRGHMPSWRVAIDDLARVADEVQSRHPGRPLHLYGVSLGGVFATAAVLAQPGRFASVVMSSPGFAAHIRLPLKRRLRLLKRSFTKPTKLYKLPFGVEQLTDRTDWQQRLVGDELRSRRVSARFLVEIFRMQGYLKRRMAAIETPLLALIAGADVIVDNEAVTRVLERATRAPVRIETYAGAAHILPASLPRAGFVDRLARWLGAEHGRLALGCETTTIDFVAPAPEDLAAPPELTAR